ncbi:MAG: UDP-N-acetylglucosamine 1-carboxyvinyltransferase [Bacillota bacterium]|nr:MAG: UDP-N-acetylglucosamine 1-carboxyvinyltransferase [Bacillota bacterium]MBS3951165.1 UDP-N-acetylglucosamine 1-carboxyvinyltransferase [Peptococcaceae bacterium]
MGSAFVRGGVRLGGEVSANGSKYVALSALPAALLANGPVIIENLPDLSDVRVFCEILRKLGATVTFEGGIATIDPTGLKPGIADPSLVKKLRASYYLLGVLLARFGEAEVALPGGDDIGPRPIDQHLKGFRALGAETSIEHGNIKVYAEKLNGASIYLDVVSLGATVNIMLAAVLAEGQTTIVNADRGPWIIDLANMLNAMGARIFGTGTETIRIQGVKELHGCRHYIIPDQSEAATLMIATAFTGGNVLLKNIIPTHLDAITAKLRETGAVIVIHEDSVRVIGPSRPSAVNVKTLPYPGFFTDFQAPMSTMLTVAEGTSIVTETIWEERFKHLEELTKMGAKARIEGRSVFIEGVRQLSCAEVTGTDLRASASLMLAGLVADGDSLVHGIDHMDRGYERLDLKLNSLGADIKRL